MSDNKAAAAFKSGRTRNNVYNELSKEGIKEGKYKVNLVKVVAATTSGGKPIVRFTYKLVDDYTFKEQTLKNVHINTTSSDEWNQEYETNFALQMLGELYEALSLDTELEDISTEALVKELTEFILDGLKDVAIEVNVKVQKVSNSDIDMVFYSVYLV